MNTMSMQSTVRTDDNGDVDELYGQYSHDDPDHGDCHGRRIFTNDDGEEVIMRIRLAWENISVCVKKSHNIHADADDQSSVVLHDATGFAEPGRLLAIMGPSGSGKTTLVDTLSGRLGKYFSRSGTIWVNGQQGTPPYGLYAHVTQDDTLIGTLTVQEALSYSASLRLPRWLGRVKMGLIVQEAMVEMGLQDSAHTPIGNWHLRGLSGGERRRLSIAIEILTRPSLVFLDEPTSGLDSASAFFVVKALQRLAQDGRTIIASIHQPSSEVYELFDYLFLLSSGRTVYFGETMGACEHFAMFGFPCPPLRNPSDHFLHAINADFDKARRQMELKADAKVNACVCADTATVVDILTSAYNNSAAAWMATSTVYEISQMKGSVIKERFGSQPTLWMQAWTLTSRSSKNMFRDMGYYWLRLCIYILVSFCIGTIYYHIGTDFNSIMARASCMSYVSGFLTFMAIGGFPSFVEDMKVFTHERTNGHYGVVAFVIGNSLSCLPFLFLISLFSTTICYCMVGLHPGIGHYLYFLLCLLAGMVVVESLMMAIASVVPNYLMGIITGAGIQGIFLLAAGFFRLPNDLPAPVWKYPLFYLSFHSYSLQGMYKNDFLGLNFKSRPGEAFPKLVSGQTVLEEGFEIQVGARSKWWDLGILLGMAVGYRMLFLLMIKIRDLHLVMQHQAAIKSSPSKGACISTGTQSMV